MKVLVACEESQAEDKMKSQGKKGKVGVYRFYNLNQSAYGEPFGLCDNHRKNYKYNGNIILTKLADKSTGECVFCLKDDRSYL